MTRLRTGLYAVVLLGLLALPVAAKPEGGKGTVWRSTTVRVRIYTTANWHPLIARTIADYNAIMPQRGPTLVASIQPEKSCTWVRKQRFRKATITICSQPDGDGAGTTRYKRKNRTFADKRVKITLIGDASENRFNGSQNTVCHEMMHALTGIGDDSTPRDSCVQGRLDAPGAWDVAYLEQAYQRQGGQRGRK